MHDILLKCTTLSQDVIRIVESYLVFYSPKALWHLLWDERPKRDIYVKLSGIFHANTNSVGFRINNDIVVMNDKMGTRLQIKTLFKIVGCSIKSGNVIRLTARSNLIDEASGDSEYASFWIHMHAYHQIAKNQYTMDVKLILPDIPFDDEKYAVCENPEICDIEVIQNKDQLNDTLVNNIILAA